MASTDDRRLGAGRFIRIDSGTPSTAARCQSSLPARFRRAYN
jgi:hypothetical protein